METPVKAPSVDEVELQRVVRRGSVSQVWDVPGWMLGDIWDRERRITADRDALKQKLIDLALDEEDESGLEDVTGQPDDPTLLDAAQRTVGFFVANQLDGDPMGGLITMSAVDLVAAVNEAARYGVGLDPVVD